jgi:predicted nucleotidyltransferase
MVIHRVLDEVFRSWSHVAVLRALVNTTIGFTGNETSRRGGMSRVSALRALTNLEQLGVVKRARGGRDHIFTLNREHFLVRSVIIPLYENESRFRARLMGELRTGLKNVVVSAVLYGSVARREETAESDLDVCCIVGTGKEKKPLRDQLDRLSSTLRDRFGVRLSPIIFTRKEFRSQTSSSLVHDLASHGIVICGDPLSVHIR